MISVSGKFHCACLYDATTGQQVQECTAHEAMRERNLDLATLWSEASGLLTVHSAQNKHAQDAAEARIAELESALRPFAVNVRAGAHDDFPVHVSFSAGDIRRAHSVLENSKAALADAHSKKELLP